MMLGDSRSWLWLVGALLLAWLIYLLQPVLMPFLVATLLAYLGDPLADRLEARGLSRTWSVVAVFTFFSLTLLLMLLVLLPLLGRQLLRVYELLPLAVDLLQQQTLPWLQRRLGLEADFWQVSQLRELLAGHLGQTTDIAQTLLRRVASSGLALLALLGNLALIPVVGFYLLRDWDVMLARLHNLLPRRQERLVTLLARECHEVLGAFLRGQLLVMLALALVYAAGLMLVGLELGLLIGLLAGLASIVPYLGFVVGIVAALLAVLFQFGFEWYPLIGVVAVFTAGQLLEGMWLTPTLVGDRIGLHPVAVIFAILAGGQLFGFTGVLLALPVAAVIMVLLRHVHDFYKLSALYAEPQAVDEERESP
ncbi:AI-2E family transporter [Pseudomonas sp. NW5]|uniref:AI-2E family transporter n=1 Tax=Pseudomonas sp. NW5 TaxID=2934934 RepID=UPI00201FE7D9|nr:AI-2E family transporter [Pseudomonas sp. NW5]MCL7462339.1 AI-2E family transporter [Pseudomonas sp. NW5]